MNVLSLFSGIGGLELGLERAGMTVVGQVEIDPFCRQVLAKHWPEVPRHDDARTCADWWRGEQRPRVDLVCGGFPCQPVSLAGRRRGQDDARWLWPAFADVVRLVRPRWVLLENVPGLLVRGVGDVLGDLAALGYDTEWDCIPAAAVGAPHLRWRWFCIAYAQCDGLRQQPVAESGRRGRAVADGDGTPRAVAHTDSGAMEWRGRRGGTPEASELAHTHGQRRQFRTGPRGERSGGPQPAHRSPDMANSHGPRRGPWEGLGPTWPPPVRTSWWSTEPDVGRVAHGVPARVDRLRALGNAVVPQVAEHVGRLIMAAHCPHHEEAGNVTASRAVVTQIREAG